MDAMQISHKLARIGAIARLTVSYAQLGNHVPVGAACQS
jgi:hypothetical protein